jgi:creatinine amidohydrolase/Fe(II)-dependent formamide hydrolase-like protein
MLTALQILEIAKTAENENELKLAYELTMQLESAKDNIKRYFEATQRACLLEISFINGHINNHLDFETHAITDYAARLSQYTIEYNTLLPIVQKLQANLK